MCRTHSMAVELDDGLWLRRHRERHLRPSRWSPTSEARGGRGKRRTVEASMSRADATRAVVTTAVRTELFGTSLAIVAQRGSQHVLQSSHPKLEARETSSATPVDSGLGRAEPRHGSSGSHPGTSRTLNHPT